MKSVRHTIQRETIMRILTILCLLALLPAAAMADQSNRRISVTGQGQATAAPDIAMISVGVQSTTKTAADAISANSDIMDRVFKAVIDQGIKRKDMQTSQFSVGPVWQDRRKTPNEPPKITGFQVNNILSIKVRDISAVGTVIDTLSRAGANRFNGISFQIGNPAPLLDQARQDAVKDARRKAELMAAAAGVKLGPVLSISDAQRQRGGGPVAMEMAAMSRSAPIAKGELSLSVQAYLVFGIASE